MTKRKIAKILLKSAHATKAYAGRLAVDVVRKTVPQRETATVIGFVGELGSGKTTFVQGFAKKLCVKERLSSPTFLIFRSYRIPISRFATVTRRFTRLYHVDLYRLHSAKDLAPLGFREILKNPENIVLIEWADKIKKILPKSTRWVILHHGVREHERMISIT